MPDLDDMLKNQSPERRRLIARLLQRDGLHMAAPRLKQRDIRGALSDGAKEEVRNFYNSVSDELNDSMFGTTSLFLNLGYAVTDNPQLSPIALPEHLLDRNSVKLVLESVAEVDLSGRQLLDVGCGRGGTLVTLTKYFDLGSAVGVDLAVAAIGFCQRHVQKHLWFLNSDAENLPFAAGAFDVVTNIESSHSYPNVLAFYREVERVLCPGGYFLYADVFADQARLWQCLECLENLGFTVERNQDITLNVLASCDQVAGRRLRAFDEAKTEEMGRFLSAPGSALYELMAEGTATFRILRLRKGDGVEEL